MIDVFIPFDRVPGSRQVGKLYLVTNYAIQLSDWCKDQGLIMGMDFEWAVDTYEEKIRFSFMNRGGKYSTMFALTFGC